LRHAHSKGDLIHILHVQLSSSGTVKYIFKYTSRMAQSLHSAGILHESGQHAQTLWTLVFSALLQGLRDGKIKGQ
jgi:hypothetical protein